MRSVLLLLFLISCTNVNKLRKEGNVYLFRSEGGYVVHTLILADSSLFEYKISGDLNSYSSKGKWSFLNNEIILSSFNEFRSGYCTVKDGDVVSSLDSFEIFITDTLGLPFPFAGVQYNNAAWQSSDRNGRITIKKSNSNEISISYLGMIYSCAINASLNLSKEIVLIPRDNSKLYFKDEHWLKKGKNIKTSSGITLLRSRNRL